jgi:transposase-like protein
MTLIQKAFINGVSTRRIERLAKAIGIENISAAQVSEFTEGLEDQAVSFRTRPLEKEYPFVWIDVLYDKVRMEDRVVSLALMIAHGVNKAGEREILAVEPMFDETEDSWRAFFRKLKGRSLKRLSLCISDAHAGQFYHFPEIDKRRISSTNVVERIVRETQRRSRVIGVFPTVDSYVRLVTCYLVEYSEDWGTDRSYIKQEKVLAALEHGRELSVAQSAN